MKKPNEIIDKLRYLNRLLIDTSKTTKEIAAREETLVRALDQVQDSLQRSQGLLQTVEESITRWEQADRLTGECVRRMKYVNLEYFPAMYDRQHKILLAGFYGARNLGDELMFRKVYEDLDVRKDQIYVLMCDNDGLDVFDYPGINILHYPKTKYDYNFLAREFDVLIFGGGAIIDDGAYRLEESYTYDMGRIFIELSLAFIEKGKKVFPLALSASSDLTDPGYIRKLKRVAEGSADFSVRDRYSAALIRRLTGVEVKVVNDIVFSYDLSSEGVPEKPGDDRKVIVGIVWICYENVKRACIELIGRLQEHYGDRLEIRLIPFYDYRSCDKIFYEAMAAEISGVPIRICEMPGNFRETCDQIRGCDLLISMRYHGALIGMMAGRKTYSLLYSEHSHYYNKMTDLYEKCGKPGRLTGTAEELYQKIVSEEEDQRPEERPLLDNQEYWKILSGISADFREGRINHCEVKA